MLQWKNGSLKHVIAPGICSLYPSFSMLPLGVYWKFSYTLNRQVDKIRIDGQWLHKAAMCMM